MESKFYQITPYYIGIVNNHRIYTIDRYITDDFLFFKGSDPSMDGILITKKAKEIIEKHNIDPVIIKEEITYKYSIKHNAKVGNKKLPVLYELGLMPQIDVFEGSQLIFKTKKGKIIITEKMREIIKKECKRKRIRMVDLSKKENNKDQEEDLSNIIVAPKGIYKQPKENYLFQLSIIISICIGLFYLIQR